MIVEVATLLLFSVGGGYIFFGIIAPPVLLLYGGMFLAHCWAIVFLLYKFLLVPILPFIGYLLIIWQMRELPIRGFIDHREPSVTVLFLLPAMTTAIWWAGSRIQNYVQIRKNGDAEDQ